MDARRLLDQLTGAGRGDVRVRQGQEGNLASILQGLAGGSTGSGQGGGLASGLGALLGGLTQGQSGAPGQGAPAAGGTAGGSSLGNAMGGALRDAGAGSRSDYGTSAGGNMADARGGGGIGDLLSGALGPGGLLSGGAGKGALAAGLVGMLMRSGNPRKMAANGLKIGGLALIGGLAYQAWRSHQQGQEVQAAAQQGAQALAPPPQDSAFAPDDEADAMDRSRALIRAMIAVAKADGHIDAEEEQRLSQAMQTLDLDEDDRAFLMNELNSPLDIDAVAREAKTPEMASELYVASLMVAAEIDDHERRYLDALAERMGIVKGLQEHLEAQVQAAQA